MNTPYVIGVTGNIASGKSTVRGMLASLGAATLDADRVVHELYDLGDPVYSAVVREFGPRILGQDAAIDRRVLGSIVFADPDALRRLEAIVHPAVVAREWAWVAAQTLPVAVLEAVKLVESGSAERCNAVWVVTASPDVQHRRLLARSGITEADAQRRLAAQPPLEPKLARATLVLTNDGTLDALRASVTAAWAALPDLSV